MPGIYIHLPFCKKRCNYCDFYSSTNASLINNYIEALKKELIIRKDYLLGQPVETIYLGGGTPSLINPEKIADIIQAIYLTQNVINNPEITIEINPDDVYAGYFNELVAAGINRVSIGVQSFNIDILKFLGRRHNVDQVFTTIEACREAGLNNISIDLIYGIPGLSFEMWKDALNKAFELKIQHLSAYHLSFEEGTPLFKLLKSNKTEAIKEEESWRQFKFLHDYSVNQGFEHYEISNLALAGKHSRHNSNYWNNVPYLGLGPSSHSFNGNSREWNCSDTIKYINSLKEEITCAEKEDLTLKDKLNDYILTKLRTRSGIDLEFISKNFGKDNLNLLLNSIKKYTPEYATITENFCFLTLKGWFISDKIIGDLMR